jgi:hypothetical protein
VPWAQPVASRQELFREKESRGPVVWLAALAVVYLQCLAPHPLAAPLSWSFLEPLVALLAAPSARKVLWQVWQELPACYLHQGLESGPSPPVQRPEPLRLPHSMQLSQLSPRRV